MISVAVLGLGLMDPDQTLPLRRESGRVWVVIEREREREVGGHRERGGGKEVGDHREIEREIKQPSNPLALNDRLHLHFYCCS